MTQNTAKSSPRDVLMHLLLIGLLYVATFNFIRLVFTFIETAFPDPLNTYYDPRGAMRWPLAILLILFPVFLWISRFLIRDLAAHPEKTDLKIRRWLLYITLFLTAALIIGDLVALVFNFLNGDLTPQFILKIVTVLVVAVAIFYHYLYELRRKPTEFSQGARMLGWTTVGVVALAVVAGFVLAGSPFTQRLVRFDAQKVGDLQTIQWQIVNYWQKKEKLPATLADLNDTISGFKAPVDPQTGDAYRYSVKGPLAFELCAEFNLDAETNTKIQRGLVPVSYPAALDDSPDVWNHPMGTFCFPRTIDPELYRPKSKP